jgi:hypothetical protein
MAGGKKARSKAKAIQSSDEGERFDFNVSDSSESDTTGVQQTGSGASRPRAAPAATVKPTVNRITPTPPTVLVNADAAKLLAPMPTTGSNRSPQAQDTNYFYVKRSIEVNGEMIVRKVCRICS